MAQKRPRDDDDTARPAKKQRKPFSVGPANLPDGSHKRKVQKIKKDLIHKAKLKRDYAKVKAREEAHEPQKSVYDREDEAMDVQPTAEPTQPTLDPHPDRLKLLEEAADEPEAAVGDHSRWQRKRRPRQNAFMNETEFARRRKEEAEARQQARRHAEEERLRKTAERERFRKTMSKARSGGSNGQRRLGRESVVLLEKVKKLVTNV
ncbi:hypothetical protein EJ04DRAFT_342895 [Polyplosphaeria fusca]|uniref:rRNA-processing protein FYV7 n=1 Tax=Polyplosphaeria fusca TaxID=682080 RepID=A0A9P4V1B5_9PLEO|nr:hypothetical protein EJ04DRAFT_342895 [Polyplosphaeria fusca]